MLQYCNLLLMKVMFTYLIYVYTPTTNTYVMKKARNNIALTFDGFFSCIKHI